jgi:DNA-binding LacI/PurR family transcriptional regulator
MDIMRREDRVNISGLRRLTVTPLMASQPAMEPGRAILLVATSPMRIETRPGDGNQLMLGMLRGAAEMKAPIIVTHSYTLRTTPPHGFLQLSPHGLLVWGVLEPEGYREFEKLPLPVVMVDRPVGQRPIHSVCVDNLGATRDAVRRLVELGHRRIGFVRRVSLAERDVDPDSRERQAAYRRALQEAGIRYQRDYIYSILPQDTVNSSVVRSIIGNSAISAVVCADSASASVLSSAARKFGRAIPRDLSIVCFQGSTWNEKIAGPAIDFFELGRRAARCVELPRRPPQCVRISCNWQDANTIGPAPRNV